MRRRRWSPTPTWPVSPCVSSVSSRRPCRAPDFRRRTVRTPTPGTLFPNSSKKTARAINAASGNRPLVVLANLSGFDGSPESMRKLQLEYGAEIGRAIVNFDGPIAFCVISRYHGGAFVVFSKTLNPRMTVLAVDGSFASVLGGAPAAAAVFGGEVSHRTAAVRGHRNCGPAPRTPRGAERTLLEADLEDMRSSVRAEKLGEVAAEFDKIHNIRRAVEVGSVDAVIPAAELRPGSSPRWATEFRDPHTSASRLRCEEAQATSLETVDGASSGVSGQKRQERMSVARIALAPGFGQLVHQVLVLLARHHRAHSHPVGIGHRGDGR